MTNTIHLKRVKIYAYHGCLPEEATIGGHYEVNISIETDFIQAALDDDLEKTIDYVLVNKIVKEEMAIRSKLIETVAHRILKRCENELKLLQKITIEIIKICPPINGDVESVSVVLEEKYS